MPEDVMQEAAGEELKRVCEDLTSTLDRLVVRRGLLSAVNREQQYRLIAMIDAFDDQLLKWVVRLDRGLIDGLDEMGA